MGLRNALTLVGTVVGAFGGPMGAQIGATIGGVIGSLVDPQRVKLPSIGEIQVQKQGEGQPINELAGTTGGAGTLIYCSAPDVVTVKEQQGKGGPVVESERVYLTFAILIGRSIFDGPGRRDGIKRLLRVWEDETLVYDVRPDSQILAESREYATTFTFYPGDEVQLPDPDIEAIEGVGNVPAYRGRCYFVKKRYDATDRRGTVPQYRFEVATDGELSTVYRWWAGPVDGPGGTSGYATAESPQGLLTATPTPLPAVGDGALTNLSVANGRVFFHRSNLACVSLDNGVSWTACNDPLTSGFPEGVFWNGRKYWHGGVCSDDGVTWTPIPDLPATGTVKLARDTDHLVVVQTSDGTSHVTFDDAATWAARPTTFAYTDVMATDGDTITFSSSFNYQHYTGDVFQSVPAANPTNGFVFGNFYSNGAWYAIRFMSGSGITSAYGILRTEDPANWPDAAIVANYAFIEDGVDLVTNHMAFDGEGVCLSWQVQGGSTDLYASFSNGVAWEGIGTLSGQVQNIATSLLNGTIVTPGFTNYAELVRAIGRRCGLPDSAWNLPGLSAKTVRGFAIGSQQYTGADAINALRLPFPSDGACYNGKINLILRGGAVDLPLSDDDLVDDASDLEQQESLQSGDDRRKALMRLPAKVSLMFPNAVMGYALTKATSPDYGDGPSVSETTIEVPIVLDEVTEAPQLADVLSKILRTEAEGEFSRLYPMDIAAKAVPGTVVRLISGGIQRRVRVEESRYIDGTVRLLMKLDRPNDYLSQAQAQASAGWPKPPPSLPGQTVALVLTCPALVDGNDGLGVYVAISGQPGTAWQGCRIDWRVQGATDWTTAGTFTQRAVMGQLIDDFPAGSQNYPDHSHHLTVRLLLGDDLESLSYSDWLSERGGWAIVRNDNTVELGQSRFAEPVSGQDWDLREHQRGRLATSAAAHAAGASIVWLDGLIWLPLPASAMTKTLQFRFVSIGSTSETAPVRTVTWAPALSQVEMPVHDLVLDRDAGQIAASWTERRRFGTDVTPIRSANWEGFRVTFSDGTTTQTHDVTAASLTVTDVFSGPVTVTVRQINRFTGEGPAVSETV